MIEFIVLHTCLKSSVFNFLKEFLANMYEDRKSFKKFKCKHISAIE